MVVSMIVAVSIGIQPMCTRDDFQKVFGDVIQDNNSYIAEAVFDDYLEQVQQIESSDYDKKLPPIKRLQNQLNSAIEADTLFDSFVSSLSVLGNDARWKRSVMDLRRSVLLNARKVNNPWPATVWVNLPNIAPVSDSTADQINTFIIENIDNDRTDRFSASAAILSGDKEACRQYEKRAMARWNEYVTIIEPHINKDVEVVLYPQLSEDESVIELTGWVLSNIEDKDIKDKATLQLAFWTKKHNKQKLDAITVIRSARTSFGFDPWSRGCGVQAHSRQSRKKNELLKKTAAIQETNNEYLAILLSMLTPEQRQQFEER